MPLRLPTAAPLIFRSKALQGNRSEDGIKCSKEMAAMVPCNSSRGPDNLMLMMEIRKKMLTFRDLIDLPPCDSSGPILELMLGTVEDLHNFYPNVVVWKMTSEAKETSINQGLFQLYSALNSLGELWAKNHSWIAKFGDHKEESMEDLENVEFLGGNVIARLIYMINIAREMFDVMDEDEENEGRMQRSTLGDVLSESYSDKKITCQSPKTPAIFPPELGELVGASYSKPFLFPLRLQALGKLSPIDMRCKPFNISPNVSTEVSSIETVNDQREGSQEVEKSPAKASDEGINDSKATGNLPKIQNCSSNMVHKATILLAVPPRPPTPTHCNPPPRTALTTQLPSSSPPKNATAAPPLPPLSNSNVPLPVQRPPMPLIKGAAPPPPPPLGVANALRPKKTNAKLKRSTHMGNLYRLLKRKVEGSSSNGKLSTGRKKSQVGGSSGGKQGMADALAEMTKRSAYFQQIEEDVQKHAKLIIEMKTTMNSFQTKDMAELLRFHKHVDRNLEKLTDETQVLARFEGFPTKKLESLRIAAALYLKLEGIATNLENWKTEPPVAQLLDKVESYFNKVKTEVDALERSKDEESKRFQSQNIHFDFNILARIKESMVDVSSSCMELALKERRDMKATASAKIGPKAEGHTLAHIKMLWRAFQLAFRIYSFAGGQDDRADRLSRELAQEIAD